MIRQMIKIIENRIKKTIIFFDDDFFDYNNDFFDHNDDFFDCNKNYIFNHDKNENYQKNIIIIDEKALKLDIERLINW